MTTTADQLATQIAGELATGGPKRILVDSDGDVQIDIKSETITKTIQTELKALAVVAADAQDVSTILDLSGDEKKVAIYIDHGRTVADAFVGAGTEYRIEASQKATGDDTWRTVNSMVCGIAAASTIAMDAEEAAGQTQIETGATLPAVGDIVLFNNATIANAEFAKVVAIDASVDTEHFDIQDGLTNVQAAINVFNKCEQFAVVLDVSAITRLRVIANNNNGSTNREIVWRCAAVTQE